MTKHTQNYCRLQYYVFKSRVLVMKWENAKVFYLPRHCSECYNGTGFIIGDDNLNDEQDQFLA